MVKKLITAVLVLAASCTSTTDTQQWEPSNALAAMAPGVPFGAFGLLQGDHPPASLRLHVGSVSAGSVDNRLSEARNKGYRLVFTMTGGSHAQYMSDKNGGTCDLTEYRNGRCVFDLSRWKQKMNTFNTAAIRDMVAKGVADGTIVGNSVMDEPHVCGSGDGNNWGPCGTMTKAMVDGMCGYVKNIFPTLPVGAGHAHDKFQPEKNYAVCDFIMDQYSTRRGDVSDYRDASLAWGRRSGITILFSMNVLNGGKQDRDGNWDCKDEGGMKGTREPNCKMTGSQIQQYGLVLGPAGCALNTWTYEETFYNKPANEDAFQTIANKLAQVPAKECRRV